MRKKYPILVACASALMFVALAAAPALPAGWTLGLNTAPGYDYYHLTAEMRTLVEDILYRRFYTSEEQLARGIFDWVVENIDYEDNFGVASARKVFENRRGKCGGQTRLFIALARDLGLDARYVLVDRDQSGRPVKHACAWVRLDGQTFLVDPASGIFDARHQSWRIAEDSPGYLLLALTPRN
ncbi:MAG: transglutaminase-like domain-containing protein [Candidatus Erginobacter occultus]|nr:transglutaminase-like domain-containing protein [Candidatus Erginobacter occultus]